MITKRISQFLLTTNFQNRSFIHGHSTLVRTSRYVNCCPTFNSTAPTTFFSPTTLTLVTTASLLSINNALIEQTSPTQADNVVMQSVANAHVRTELCCKSRDTGLDITTLFSFSHWTTVKPIFRNVILSITVEKINKMTHERSTVEKYIQRWARNGVFFVSDYGHDHVDLLGIVIG